MVKGLFGEPLEGVEVYLMPNGPATRTDANGEFSLGQILTGKKTPSKNQAEDVMLIRFSKQGYTTVTAAMQWGNFENVLMCPVPFERGIFFIDESKQQLQPLEAIGYSYYPSNYNHEIRFEYTPMSIVQVDGDSARFLLNMRSLDLSPCELRKGSIYFEPGGNYVINDARLFPSTKTIGEEQLVIAAVKVESDKQYAWENLGSFIRGARLVCIPFEVKSGK